MNWHNTRFPYPLQCFFLKLNGLWPVDLTFKDLLATNGLSRKILIYAYYSIGWFGIIDVIFIIGSQIYYQLSVLDNMVMLIEASCSCAMGFLVLSRMVHLQCNHANVREIHRIFVKHIWVQSERFPHEEKECRRRMRPYLVMSSLMCSLMFMYISVPVGLAFQHGWDSPDKPFPFRMLFLYDAQRRWPYIFTFKAGIYSIISGGTTMAAEDSLIGYLLAHTCAQFQILHNRILNIKKESCVSPRKQNNCINESQLQVKYIRELNNIARKHNMLIQFVQLLEKTISYTILVNFALSTLVLCLVGFQLATGKDMILGEYLKFTFYICNSLSQLYLLCSSGDRLIQTSLETANKLYACNWEGLNSHGMAENDISPASKEFRQNLQIMIMCSQRPVRVSAGKFATISLQSFLSILSSSFSYFTVLHTIYKQRS